MSCRGSALSPSSSYTPGGAAEDFTFGQHSPGTSMGGAGPTAMSPRSGLPPVAEPGGGIAEDVEEDEENASVSALRAAPGAGLGPGDALPQGFGTAAARSPSAAEASPSAASRGFGMHDASTQDEQAAQSSTGGFGSPRSFGVGDDAAVQAVADVSERGAGEFGVGDDYAAGTGGFGSSVAGASAAAGPALSAADVQPKLEAEADEYADEEFEEEEVAEDVAKLGAAGGFAGASGVAAAGAAAAEAAAVTTAAEQHAAVRAMEAEGHSGDSGETDHGGRGSARATAANTTAAGLATGIAALDIDHDVAGRSEAGVTDMGDGDGQPGVPESPGATTPGPSASASRSTPPPAASSMAGLSPEVAQLLSSPSMRSRVASAVSVRNMGSALDICAAALQAVQRSLDSYSTLMAEPHAAPAAAGGKRTSGPGNEAATSTAVAGAGTSDGTPSGNGAAAAWSPTLCGKVRSLQDALQTLLAHTTLLLGDVQVYSESTQSPEARSNGGSGDGATSPSLAPARDYKAEAALLLEVSTVASAVTSLVIPAVRQVAGLPMLARCVPATASAPVDPLPWRAADGAGARGAAAGPGAGGKRGAVAPKRRIESGTR